MLVFYVFGRLMGVERAGNEWQIFSVSASYRKISRLYDIVIPSSLQDDEIIVWIDDMYHESATEMYPNVVRLQ